MERTRSNILGKYRLIAELGHGGMAEVFLAVAQGPAGFNKLTVIKQIRPQLADDPEFLAMFLDEARLAARLNHPNVVQTNEVGHDGNRYFIAMEYLEGQPLNRVLHRIGRDKIPLAMHLRLIADGLSGLHYAHELADYDGTPLEVVHRDVTPHNVFVTYDGQVKVVDFGIAKAMSSSSETRTGVLKGKVSYMAPEQARGVRVDRRADIFSVGVMLWEAAVGKRLWVGVPDIAILGRLASGDLPRPSQVRPDVTPELEAVVLKAMALSREARHQTAGELQEDIERLLDRMGERVAMRDVGQLIAQHFQEERGK
ncbi:MAG TPA: serine/threonine-protein kinase, partial [Candidatus Nanopelagicales bacterium]|nr:serine/threonine-protein kinase [Candidatus Nanopelagicales bacterium]